MRGHHWWFGLLVTLFWVLSGSRAAQANTVVHDAAHLLTPEQRQTIIRQNQTWQTARHHPQLWVYTYRKLPGNGLDGFNYQDPFDTPGNELVERLFSRIAHQASTPQASTGDTEYAINHQIAQLHRRVSVILVYPDQGWHTVIAPADDLYNNVSDFQKWQLTTRLPNHQGTGTATMAFFTRYQKFLNRHIANVRHLRPGMSWARLTLWLLAPLLLWGLWRFLRGIRHVKFSTDNQPGDSAWGSYWFGRYMGGDHDHWFGPWY